MSTPWTKGPWEFEDIGEPDDNVRINQWERIEANKVAIAIVPIGYSEPFESEQKANAALIAAAPSLHEALTMLANDSECYCTEKVAVKHPCGYCLARAALAMAGAK